MKSTMTPTKAREKSITAVCKIVGGHKVWPLAYGHMLWLRKTRKNRFVANLGNEKYQATDFDCVEFCFAFLHDPIALQSLTGVKATKQINDFLLGSTQASLSALFSYSAEQLTIYIKTQPRPKKAMAASRREHVARSRQKR